MEVLVVDDEPPAVAQIQWLLSGDSQVGRVHTAGNAAQAKHVLETEPIDVILLDIHMPGQSGMDLARQLQARAGEGAATERPEGEPGPQKQGPQTQVPQTQGPQAPDPQIIFITADAAPAVDAFELQARDYLLKPVRQSRLSEALRRAGQSLSAAEPEQPEGAQRVSVLQGDTTVLVEIASIRWVQAQGDYARLYTAESSYLLRIPLAELEEQWEAQGFVRVHRSHVVNLHHVRRIVNRQGRMTIQLPETELPVSRRLMPHVRERLDAHRVRAGRAAK
nr:LytTR family DNA-binding domain-containing protein [Nesterenkonia lacusekhoensis]